MKTKIEILHYYKYEIFGQEMHEVGYHIVGDERIYKESISKGAMMGWAQDTGILEWSYDAVDYDGSHIEKSGKMDLYDWADRIDLFDIQEFLEDKYSK